MSTYRRRAVAACQRGHRIGEWRTNIEGRCTYHSDGKRTVTGESIVHGLLSHLRTKIAFLSRFNEAYDVKFGGGKAP